MSNHETEVILRHDGEELAHVTLTPGEYIIGRDATAHISVDLPGIAQQHARLIIASREVLVEDLGGPDGTFFGDEPIRGATRLLPHQPVRLGDVLLEIRRPGQVAQLHSEPAPSAPAAQQAVHRFLAAELAAENRYRMGETVALGGMGAILSAREGPTKRTVAMKVMLGASSERSVLRFIAEAQVTAQLEHPNIVPVHEVGVDDRGQLYYTMKMVRGITLKKVLDLMSQGVAATLERYPLASLLTIFQKVCDAVAFAHSKGVLHRDLKPENIMLDDFGVVLLMDWGLAKVIGREDLADYSDAAGEAIPPARRWTGEADRSSGSASSVSTAMTMAGTVLGTPKFMSPEQARGEIKTLDARSDVYSLGVILFQMLYLRTPIDGRKSSEVISKVLRGEIIWPGNFLSPHLPGRRVPDSLAAVCRKALALDRARRYPAVGELQADIAAYQAGFATAAENASAWKQFRLLVGRHRASTGALAALLLLSGFFTVNLSRERDRVAQEAARANQALAELKKSAPAFRQLADGEARALRFAAALDKLDTAIALDPGQPADRWRRAYLLIGLERFSEAAAALREAARLDPARARSADIAPLLDRMDTARPSRRYSMELAWPVYDQLFAADLTGEALILSRQLLLDADKRLPLVQRQLANAYPAESFWVSKTMAGQLHVHFVQRVGSVEGLRGVPFDRLVLENSDVKDLEPLRGLHAVELSLTGNSILSLEPLRGMPLETLQISCGALPDLEPLRGMPLRCLRLEACTPAIDLTPLLECKQLEALIFTGMPANVDALRHHPRIERLSGQPFVEFGHDFSAVPDATEFWQKRSAQR